ncbi:MAG TPA: ComF family protein [Verrucomicrobiae bacterium]|jgi:ComF family protein
MISALKTAYDAALNFFYPPVCQLCKNERAMAKDGYVGGKCWSGLRFLTEPYCERCGLPYEGNITHSFVCQNCKDMDFGFSFARSAMVANPLILQAIALYKYNRAVWFEPFLGDLLTRKAVPALSGQKWDAIVPVPLHPVRQREREFNQAERIALHLGKALNLPVKTNLVRRAKFTGTQTQLSREKRAANMDNAFFPTVGKSRYLERLILVDDVLTTGATTSACARALREGGAKEVCVWTVARGT